MNKLFEDFFDDIDKEVDDNLISNEDQYSLVDRSLKFVLYMPLQSDKLNMLDKMHIDALLSKFINKLQDLKSIDCSSDINTRICFAKVDNERELAHNLFNDKSKYYKEVEFDFSDSDFIKNEALDINKKYKSSTINLVIKIDVSYRITSYIPRINEFIIELSYLFKQFCYIENILKTISANKSYLNLVYMYRLENGKYLTDFIPNISNYNENHFIALYDYLYNIDLTKDRPKDLLNTNTYLRPNVTFSKFYKLLHNISKSKPMLEYKPTLVGYDKSFKYDSYVIDVLIDFDTDE